jgi:hypothetical protein
MKVCLTAVTSGAFVLLLTGCSDKASVTGTESGDPTWSGTQSETASASAFFADKTYLVIAYNDDTADGKVT